MTRALSSKEIDTGGLGPAGRFGRDFTSSPHSPAEALEPARPPELYDPEDDDRRMHPVLAFFNGLFMLVFVTAGVLLCLFYFIKYQFDRPGPLPTSTVLVVPKGQGVREIAERLDREQIITDRGLFMTSIIYFVYLRGTGTLKAGEYEFRKHATMRQVLDTLVEGKSIHHKITLPEGLTSEQIVARLLAHPHLEGDIKEIPPEGSLLPDTYRFQTGDTRQEIIERMQAGQRKFLAKVWEKRDPDIVVKTPQEALILASIVEKETGRADERPRIASVFQNRLRMNMRLQSDPTIIYGLVGGRGSLDGPIRQSDLDRETAYNTYKINGLPPTPIANPGRAAIEAVLRPAKTSDLYFVADGTGGHAFAPSLDEHNRNVANWRQIERAMRERQREEAAAVAAAQTEAASPSGGNSPEAAIGTSVAAPSAADTPGSGTLLAPEALIGPNGQSAETIGPEAAAASVPAPAPMPQAVVSGPQPAIPLPLRNPMR